MSRAVRNKVAPVADKARAVSMPMSELVPVTTMTLPLSLPSTLLSLMISSAVGRASPAPFGSRERQYIYPWRRGCGDDVKG
jgi:hypothetical protein